MDVVARGNGLIFQLSENIGFWSANKQRYYMVKQRIVQLSSAGTVIVDSETWQNNSFLDLFVQMSA